MPKNAAGCIFCSKGKSRKLRILMESRLCRVIPARDPIANGHCLVIPKRHFETIFDIDSATLADLVLLARLVAVKLKNEVECPGVNILHASGKAAQQSVRHLHLHIVPRFKNDGLNLWPSK